MAGRLRLVVAGVVSACLLLPILPAAASPAHPAGQVGLDVATAALVDTLATAAPSADRARPGDVVADRLLVTFQPGTDPTVAGRVLADAGIAAEVVPGFDVQAVDVDPDAAADLAVTLVADANVLTVEPDRVFEVHTASDPRRDEQWWWRNRRQQVRTATGEVRAGRPGIDIGAEPAWRRTRGRSGVVVAVIDTGMDIHHPDLRPNLWHNPRPGSFQGCREDVHGCNFSGQGPSGQVYANAVDDAHGTHVAGIVAAAENDVGTVGVAPRVSLMSVKFLVRREGRVSDGVRAVQYAVHSGAHVINASWSVQGRVTEDDLRRCDGRVIALDCSLAALERTIRDARIPVVVSAGNGRAKLEDHPEYPASSESPNVITVTAVDNLGTVPGFANHSTSLVDVAAPGVAILSTMPERAYGDLDGTSQAAPTVTGVVALAISETRSTDGARIAEAVRVGARPFGHLGDRGRPSGATRAGLASAPGTLQALGIVLGACPSPAPRAPFRDVQRSDVHARNIDCIVHHGLAGGYPDGRYRPAATVTRGQVATFLAGLVRTSRDLPVPSRGRFSDLRGDVHRDNIEALAAIGIIGGYRDGTYQPGNRVTREQFASLLMRTYEHLTSGRVRAPRGQFPDVGGVHAANVDTASYIGFVQGRTDGRFAPREGVTRAQLASLLRRALDKLVNDRVSSVR